jgi:hypothetical protein
MKNFRTIIEPETSKNKISYNTPALFLGSCFTENIGNRMRELKFPTSVNPFGVLYNPVSIRFALEILLDNRDFNENDLGFFNGQWFSFYHDTEFSNTDKDKCLKNINSTLNKAREHFSNAQYLMVTFGTAWVYEYIKTKKVVSNCHKIPAKEFKRYKIGVEDIFVNWAKLINRIEDFNPNLKIVFSVSPVRHWKDGAVQNQLSKSTLILAIQQIIKLFENVAYFPAYEIMMDDLRDYRFYAHDMLHPSSVAIDYIWDQFSKTYFERETFDIIKEVNQIVQAKNHRPLNPTAENHQKFVKNQISKIQELSKRYSFINFENEQKYFENLKI